MPAWCTIPGPRRSRVNERGCILLGILCLLHIALLANCTSSIYGAFINAAADIDDHKRFESRVVRAGEHQEWLLSPHYNRKSLSIEAREEMERLKTVAFLVVRDGAILCEEYWDDYGPNSISSSFSMAKSIVSILVGIAIDEGKITSVDQPIGDFLPEFSGGDKAKITIKHLLTMSSGLEWDVSKETRTYYGRNIRKLVMDLQPVEEPGKVLRYMSGNTILLAFVLEKATGMRISDYASERLWKPLGAKNPALWSLDQKGGDEKADCCFHSNARDFARIGQLYLNNGRWRGRQIVSEEYVKESTTPVPLLIPDGRTVRVYGYAWWFPQYGKYQVYYARGFLGQYVIVIPEEELVIVRLGRKYAVEYEKGHPVDLFTYIDAAMELIQ